MRQSSNIGAGKGAHAKSKEEQLKSKKKGSIAHPLFPFFMGLILVSFNLVISIITIIDSGSNSVYTPSCWTSGSLWNLSIPVPFPEANSSRAPTFKTFNGKLSWKSRWFLYKERKEKKHTKRKERKGPGLLLMTFENAIRLTGNKSAKNFDKF